MFRYDSGKRLTANGGVMDMNVVPADEERYGEPPASFSGSSMPARASAALTHSRTSSITPSGSTGCAACAACAGAAGAQHATQVAAPGAAARRFVVRAAQPLPTHSPLPALPAAWLHAVHARVHAGENHRLLCGCVGRIRERLE